MKTRAGDWVIAAILGVTLWGLLAQAAFNNSQWAAPKREAVEAMRAAPTATPVGMGLLGARVDRLSPQRDETLRKGMSGYLLIFEIISVHLLVVLVGAAYLARAKRRRENVPETV